MNEAEQFGIEMSFPRIGPENVLGIEKNSYAAELARVSVWIGEIQWMKKNGFSIPSEPILRPLENIYHADALVDDSGERFIWPDAEFIVGNPPYKGARQMKSAIGKKETLIIREAFKDRFRAIDLVAYWVENAREMIERGVTKRAGFVATNSIRKGTNLPALQRVLSTTSIFDAWPEEQWINEGAAVDVSLVCFGDAGGEPIRLNGLEVSVINADLSSGVDLTKAADLSENKDVAALGVQKSGPFDIPGDTARLWMAQPSNPNRRFNYEVLKPYWNGDDLTERPSDTWYIDLPKGLSEDGSEEYELIHAHLANWRSDEGKSLRQMREEQNSDGVAGSWWEPWRRRTAMRDKIEKLSRYLVTAETSKYHLVTWLHWPVLPDKNLVVFLRDDDLLFGLIQNRFHALWALRKGSDLQNRPRYTHTSVLATFPFPEGMTPDLSVSDARSHALAGPIEKAARELHDKREAWLWPEDLFREVPESVDALPGRAGIAKPVDQRKFPLRRVPVSANAADELAKRHLTRLYNDNPAWLRSKHAALDLAVSKAYGWDENIADDKILENLLEINLTRSANSQNK